MINNRFNKSTGQDDARDGWMVTERERCKNNNKTGCYAIIGFFFAGCFEIDKGM